MQNWSENGQNGRGQKLDPDPIFEQKFLKYDAKRDPFLISNKKNPKKYFEEKIKFKEGCLNLTEREFCLYRNSCDFLNKLEPILKSCKMKCKKKAYFHHFDEDGVFEIGEAIGRTEALVACYKSKW